MNMNYFIGKKNLEILEIKNFLNVQKKKLNYEHGAVYCWKLRNFEIQKNKSE